MKQLDLMKTVATLLERREPFALATVVRVEGSSIGKPGFKLILSKKGEPMGGTLGGGCPDSVVSGTALASLKAGTPRTVKVYLESVEDAVGATIRSQTEDEIHVETNCGGMIEVYVEPFLPQDRLVLVGQGGKDDVENSLIKLGKALDFEVTVVDHAPSLTDEPDVLHDGLDYDLGDLRLGSTDSVVVLTKGERDVEVLEKLSKFTPRFIGMLASSKRAAEDFEKLRKQGIPEKFISTIRAPVGADMGAQTPQEIAFSILADVLATKYGKTLPQKGSGISSAMTVERKSA